MTTAPIVSVCIPAYNRPEYLRQAIQSVLSQTLKDWELVVSDDFSQIDLSYIVAQFNDLRIRYIRQPRNLGMAKNWNAVLEASRGKYIKLLMDDDVLEPNCLQDQVAVLECKKNIAVVCSNYSTIDANGVLLNDLNFNVDAFRIWRKNQRENGKFFILKYLLGQRRVGLPSSILFRRQDQVNIGNFSLEAGAAADIDMWLRLCGKGDFYYCDKVHLKMRMHENNLLKIFEASDKGYEDLIYVYQSTLSRHRNNLFIRLYKKRIYKALLGRLAPFIEKATPKIQNTIRTALSNLGISPQLLTTLS